MFILRFVVFALVAALMPAASFAVPVQWTLSGVRFEDGGTASGSFVYDADTQLLSAWSLAVDGGSATAFPPITYHTSNSTIYADSGFSNPQPTIIATLGGSQRQIRVTPIAALTNAGGTVAINLATAGGNSGSIECYNCGPSREIVAGDLVGGTPTFSIRPGIAGNWNNRDQDGHGFQFELLPGGVMTAIWFAFDNAGNQAWISAAGVINGNSVTMGAGRVLAGRFPPNFNTNTVERRQWGTLVFTFSDCDNGKVEWTSTDPAFTPTGTLDIKRLTRLDGLACP